MIECDYCHRQVRFVSSVYDMQPDEYTYVDLNFDTPKYWCLLCMVREGFRENQKIIEEYQNKQNENIPWKKVRQPE